MTMPDPVEITVLENGHEEHPSWLLMRANRISSNPGASLFDSEIAHQHYVQVSVSRCTRKRDLNRDWLYQTELLIEVSMSEAQWGAFVSSFGGSGVPATLSWFGGPVPGVATLDSRLSKSHEEVKGAADKGIAKVREAERAVQEAFERNAGKKEIRGLLRNLGSATANLPSNMEFAAKSLTEHVENVVTKARYDIEGMVATRESLILGSGSPLAIEES